MGPVFGVSKTSISGFVAVGPHCIYISLGIQSPSVNRNGLLRRWLYTPLILWQGDWIPRVYTCIAILHIWWFRSTCVWNLLLRTLPNRSMSTSSSRVKAEDFVFVDIHEDVLKMKNFDSQIQWEKYFLRSTCQALFCMFLLGFRSVPLDKCTWKYELTWFIHKQPSELMPQKMSGFVYASWLDFPSPLELSKKNKLIQEFSTRKNPEKFHIEVKCSGWTLLLFFCAWNRLGLMEFYISCLKSCPFCVCMMVSSYKNWRFNRGDECNLIWRYMSQIISYWNSYWLELTKHRFYVDCFLCNHSHRIHVWYIYIWHKSMVTVGKYSIHGSYGIAFLFCGSSGCVLLDDWCLGNLHRIDVIE